MIENRTITLTINGGSFALLAQMADAAEDATPENLAAVLLELAILQQAVLERGMEQHAEEQQRKADMLDSVDDELKRMGIIR